MHKNVVVLAFSTLLGFSGTSFAAEPSAPTMETSWYGYQTLFVDAASLGVLVVGVAASNDALGALGIAGYALGGPSIHAAHKRSGAVAGSLALRLGLPLAAGGIGYAAASAHKCETDSDGNGCDWAGLAGIVTVGFSVFIGMTVASIVDAAALAHESIPASPATKPTLGFAVAPTRGGATLGASGTF